MDGLKLFQGLRRATVLLFPKKKPILLYFTTCVILLASCSGSASAGENVTVYLNEPANYEMSIDTYIAERTDISVVSRFDAYVMCRSEGVYFTEAELKVGSINVSEGDYVKKGDPLITLDTKSIYEEIDDKLKYIEDMKTQYNFERELKEYDLRIAELTLAQAESGSTNKNELSQLSYNVDSLNLELKHIKENYETSLARQYELLERLNDSLETAVLTAPSDGRVVYVRSIWPGDNIQAFNNVVYIANENDLYVKYTGEKRMYPTTAKRITGWISGKEYELEYIPLTAEERAIYGSDDPSAPIVQGKPTPPASFNFISRGSDVKPGQYVAINLIKSKFENVITVPVNAIYYGDSSEGAYVYLLKDGVKEMRSVTVGVSNESFIEVRSGLNEGDEVVVR